MIASDITKMNRRATKQALNTMETEVCFEWLIGEGKLPRKWKEEEGVNFAENVWCK